MANLKYWLWLTTRQGLSGQQMTAVLRHFGSPEGAYFADQGEYRLVEGLSQGAAQSLGDKSLDQADRILGDCDRLGIQILTLQDALYPERLAAIHQPPPVLYWKGKPIAFDEEAAIAVVGTRSATPYGVRAATQLAMELARRGALLVSGIAEGIDAAAVRGALQAGGTVASVLAGGIDVVYPKENRYLFEDVAASGALISENPPGTEPRGPLFPVRNRIISGLCVGVVAVESPRYGGTLHTVGHALEQDREVFAVPGPWDAPASEGTNRLIQEGAAKLILSGEDVLCEFADRFPQRLGRRAGLSPEETRQRLEGAQNGQLQRQIPEPQISREEKKEVDIPPGEAYIDWKECQEKLTDDQQAVLRALEQGARKADDVVEQTQLPVRRVLSALTILQVQGYVREESGKRFCLAVRWKTE
ncbi:MAG TPA: DNA-protecting protein DprA [Candidatus Enterenecus merdae]|nr:DNA-protecting protein DprA [Candidatus Enterenecus merdae]